MNGVINKSFLCAVFLLLSSFNVHAITMLTLPGEFNPPGIVGTYSNDAEFSWIKHRSPGNATYFSWNFGGGKDGGVIFNQSQAFSELTDIFIMFNQQAGFFSVNQGLSIDLDNTIDMANLRMRQAGSVIDVGSGSGYDTLVPFVDNALLLVDGQNGWSMDSSGVYHLFYNTRGVCLDCEMTVHLYGTAVVPVPAALWLFASGLVVLGGVLRARSLRC